MPVITYQSNYSPPGHTLPKYSSASNSGSAFKYRTYNLNGNSSKGYSSSTDAYSSRQLNGFRDYNSKSALSTSSLTSNYLPNKTRSLNISNNSTSKAYGTSGSLSSTPRSSISGSHSPTSTSSSSSSGSISSYNSYNNGSLSGIVSSSGVTLTSYSPRRTSLSDDFIKSTSNSLKPSTSYFPNIPSPKWRRKLTIYDTWSDIVPSELAGLTNLGNTCYMNSVLQALYCTDMFRKFVLRNSKSPLLNALSKVFEEMSDDKSSVYPSSFRNQLIKLYPKFRGYDQQDAQEFLRYLINGIHDEINQANRYHQKDARRNLKPPKTSSEAWEQYRLMDDSPLIDMFAGQLGSTIQCTVCDFQSTTFDSFLDLSLPLPSGRSECNVSKCIQEFTAVELLGPDNLIKCERCDKRTKCTKTLSIVKLPSILILHLKRFSNEGYKLTNPKITPEETLTINGRTFSLYSLVAHHGYSARSGHYTVYCSLRNKWYHMNDDKITESTKFVPSNCEDAYILFYIEKTSNFVSRL